jgi:hypothetical protein
VGKKDNDVEDLRDFLSSSNWILGKILWLMRKLSYTSFQFNYSLSFSEISYKPKYR